MCQDVFRGSKAAGGREVNYLTLSSAEVKNQRSYSSAACVCDYCMEGKSLDFTFMLKPRKL